jgi:hypothetical protein
MSFIRMLFLFSMFLTTLFSVNANEKIYIDSNELDSSENNFKIHVGHNMWLETETVHRDSTGLYTFENNIVRSLKNAEYQRQWKCPYCHAYWPEGIRCQNPKCPSKYKG